MFFAYHARSQPTGELLGAILQLPHGFFPSERDTNQRPIMDDILIRWGSRTDEWVDAHFERVINSSEAINKCSNKLASLEAMANWPYGVGEEGNEINVPAFSQNPYELIEEYGYPILGRKMRHARGTDIKLILQERDLRKACDYYTVYIPTRREYRIHVVNDEVIRVQGKFLDNPSLAQAHVRNYATGYRFRAPRLRLKPDRLRAAVSAVNCLGLDFGAVDLIVADDGLGYVLEVNTAPSCSALTLGAYAVAFQKHYSIPNEIDLSVLDLISSDIEEMDSDDEAEGEE
jgi:glutathione synthase/RimK-type ligase-like ATP-grasp enzyme